MVALKDFYPNDPDERATVDDVLRRHPETGRFIERLRRYAYSVYEDPRITLNSRQYDEWDPPLTVVVYADIPNERYGKQLINILDWINQDPDYNRDNVAVLLHSRKDVALG
jgi:hypothetical protein